MKKLRIVVVLCIILTFVVPASAISGSGTMENFQKVATYTQGQFLDVPGTAWFAPYVKEAYEYGAMTGISKSYFNPAGNLSIAETITIACWLNTTYYYGDNALNHYDFSGSSLWYLPFVDYAKENGIIGTQYDQVYEKEATRSDFAIIIGAALPHKALRNISEITDGSIPDVPAGSACYDAVYHLYRAGIISGINDSGAFAPSNNITRAEAAVILGNVVRAGNKEATTDNVPIVPETERANKEIQIKIQQLKLDIIEVEETKRIYEPSLNLYQRFLSEAENDLAKAKSKKVMVYQGGKFVYVSDVDAVSKAQAEVERYQSDVDYYTQILEQYDEKIAILENQISMLEDQME